MRRSYRQAAIFGAVLMLVACSEPSTAPSRRTAHVVAHRMADGRYAYQGDTGIWYWAIITSSGQPYTGAYLNDPVSWRPGDEPSNAELASAQDVPVTISEAPAGAAAGGDSTISAGPGPDTAPVPVEASSASASSASSSNSGGDSGGGDAGGGGD
jgi:uncharacterized membrane protein YgcG